MEDLIDDTIVCRCPTKLYMLAQSSANSILFQPQISTLISKLNLPTYPSQYCTRICIVVLFWYTQKPQRNCLLNIKPPSNRNMYYPISQDGQVQAYNQFRKKYLAEEAQRKKKQKLLRQEMGLADVNGELSPLPQMHHALTHSCPDNRGIISRILGKKTTAVR